MRQFLDSSVFILLLRFACSYWIHSTQKIDGIYLDSKICRLVSYFYVKSKIFSGYCRHSFIGIITRPGQSSRLTFDVFDNSRILRYMVNLYARIKNRLAHCLRTSLAFIRLREAREELCLSTVWAFSMIIVIALIVNIALCLVLGKQMGLWNWFMRGLFLCLGVAGLFHEIANDT